MPTAKQKLAQIAAIVNGTQGTELPSEVMGEPHSPVPWVTLEYATEAAKGKVNRDGNPIAVPAGWVYFRAIEQPLTDGQVVQLLKNTRENARMHHGIVYEYVPGSDGNLVMGSAYAGQDSAHPNLIGLVASTDEEMRAEVDAYFAQWEQEGAGPDREDFDQ